MEHNDAIQLMAAEKYLLGELTPELRDSFEEHFFSCQECAADLRASAAFVQHSKKLLAVYPATEVMPSPGPIPKPNWLAWLRPAFALPVMALLLGVVMYQNLVTYPSLKNAVAELRTPQILPSVSLIGSNSRGGSLPSVTVRAGQPFLLFVDIPSDKRLASYVAELQGPGGNREWSLTLPAQATKDTVPIRVPAGLKAAGTYTLIVRGLDSAGGAVEVGRYPFNLQVQSTR
jgi:hypothetical protein